MKASDLRQHSDLELRNMIVEQENLLQTLRFSHKVSPVENPARMQLLRRDIARMKTILTERRTA